MVLLALLLLCGYSLAQELEPEAFPDFPAQEEVNKQEVYKPKILSPQEIPQGFAAQLKAAQQAQGEVPAEEAPKDEKKAEDQLQKTGFVSYEAYLDSIELIAKLLLPMVLEKKQLVALDKKKMDKLTATIRLSQDIQPEWNDMLQENAEDVSEYKKREDKFKENISNMKVMSARINSLLKKLNVSESDMEILEKKNYLYARRMERACELMQSYILKEESQVLNTGKKEFPMTLNNYDAEKEEYQVNIKDLSSNAPFDYHGIIKVQSRLAETIDGEPDGFTASIDYINYPFVADGAKVYPGAKKAYIYYEDREVYTIGAFKGIDGFEWREGYGEWALRADSIISGKLKYKSLTPQHAMKKEPYWTAKRIFRATAFTLSAASLGLGIWQNYEVANKNKNAKKLYSEALTAAIIGNEEAHKQNARAYDNKINSLQNSQMARNGLYISAGVFSIAGVASFFF